MSSAPAITLYPARDRAIAVPLLHECLSHYFGVGLEAAAEITVDRLMDGSSGCSLHIARKGIRAVGFVTLSVLHPGLDEHGTLFLKELYVADAHRGQGCGRLIMQAVARHAVELGCRRLDWTAERTNPRALAFYDSLPAPRENNKVYYRLADAELAAFADS